MIGVHQLQMTELLFTFSGYIKDICLLGSTSKDNCNKILSVEVVLLFYPRFIITSMYFVVYC